MTVKTWCVAAVALAAGISVAAEGADYAALLTQAKDYEAKKQYASALGTYWEAARAEQSEKAADAVEGYLKLEATIEDGNPGYGDFDEFTLYDDWVLLLKDFERYWTEHPAVGFKIGDIKKGDIDRATRTASYAVRVWWGYSHKAQDMRYSLQKGLQKVRKSDWSGVSGYWPFVSVYADEAEKDGKLLRDGAALIAAPYDWASGRMNLDEHISPAAFSVFDGREQIAGRFLYDYQLAIVDEGGKTLATSTELTRNDNSWDNNGGYYDDVTFAGVTQDAMKVIDAGKATVVITALSLKYGNPDHRADGERWAAERAKLPAITYDAAQVLLEADDIDEIYNSPYMQQKKAAAQADAEAKQAAAEAEQAAAAQAEAAAENAKLYGQIQPSASGSYAAWAFAITQKQFEAVMGYNPSAQKAELAPVTNVSFYEIMAFCNRLSLASGLEPVYVIKKTSQSDAWGAIPTKKNKDWEKFTVNKKANGFRLAATSGTATLRRANGSLKGVADAHSRTSELLFNGKKLSSGRGLWEKHADFTFHVAK